MKQQGFTLIEALLAVFIFVLLISVGITSYSALVDKLQHQKNTSFLYSLIQTTRQMAIENLETAVLCPSLDQFECINDWSKPLIIFVDRNRNKRRDSTEPLINQYKDFISTQASIKYPKTQIRFNAQGMANYYNGSLSYCFKNHITGIIISRIGRIRFAQDMNGDDIPDVNKNISITCT